MSIFANNSIVIVNFNVASVPEQEPQKAKTSFSFTAVISIVLSFVRAVLAGLSLAR